MGASGADHLLPVVIMNPRRSAVLRMNERCEPQRQISRLIALDRVLFGNFHEAALVQGAPDTNLGSLGAGAFPGGSPRSEPRRKVLRRSTASQTTLSKTVREKSYWRVSVSVMEWCDWSLFGARGLKGVRSSRSSNRAMRLDYRWDKSSIPSRRISRMRSPKDRVDGYWA